VLTIDLVAVVASLFIIFTPTNIRKLKLFKWNFTFAVFKNLFTDNAYMFGYAD